MLKSWALRRKVIYRARVGFQVGTEIALETLALHELATERPRSWARAKLRQRENEINRERVWVETLTPSVFRATIQCTLLN